MNHCGTWHWQVLSILYNCNITLSLTSSAVEDLSVRIVIKSLSPVSVCHMLSRGRPLHWVKPVSTSVAPALTSSIHLPDGGCCSCASFSTNPQTLPWPILHYCLQLYICSYSTSTFHWKFVEFLRASDVCSTLLTLSFANIYLTIPLARHCSQP